MKLCLVIFIILIVRLSRAEFEFCSNVSSSDYNQEDYIGTWYIYGVVNPRAHDLNSKCMYYDGLFVGSSFYAVRHEVNTLTDKESVLIAHSSEEDYVNNSYTVYYHYDKRESETYTALCFNKNFEISYFGDKTVIYIYTRQPHPPSEILHQIQEVLAKYDIAINSIHIVPQENCGRCN